MPDRAAASSLAQFPVERITRAEPVVRALRTGMQWLFPAFAAAMAVLAAVGAVRWFSPVPYWDMWDGYLEFFLKVQDGHWGEWLAFHNEHRIVLTRVLFWLDLGVFGGTTAFLVLANWALVGAAFLLLRRILADRHGDAPARELRWGTLFIAACLLSWMQKENLTWAFQAQFFLAQWLPLAALWLLAGATDPGPPGRTAFAQAAGVGVLCLGTMANGLLALPLLALVAPLLRLGPRRCVLLGALALVGTGLYFVGWPTLEGHGSIGDAARLDPLAAAEFVLVYLGSPFFHLLHSEVGEIGRRFASLFGAAFLGLAGWQAVRLLWSPRADPRGVALAAYLAFIVGTAAATAIGRAHMGLQQATESRYTTPALMGWLVLLALWWQPVRAHLAAASHRIAWPALALALALVVVQLEALSPPAYVEQRMLAAQALALGVRDHRELRSVTPFTDSTMSIARDAVRRELGVFGMPVLKGAGAALGQASEPWPAGRCQAALLEADRVTGDARFVRLQGRIDAEPGIARGGRVWLAAPDGRLVGHALTGRGPEPQLALVGYVMQEASNQPIVVIVPGQCHAKVVPPRAPPFRLVPPGDAAGLATVDRSVVLRTEGFGERGHYGQYPVPGLQILGSYLRGYEDTGEVVLQLTRGAMVYLRTGPEPRNQRFAIGDGSLFAGHLPLAPSWMMLVFDDPDLPDRFTFTLRDEGRGWGEWSAVGFGRLPVPARP